MIKVLLDTNIIVSGLLSVLGPSAAILSRWAQGEFEVVTSDRLLKELQRVLARPKIRKHISVNDALAFVEWFKRNAIWIDDPAQVVAVTVDPDDDHVVAVAQAAQCNAIVSGDSDLLTMQDASIPVITPRAFLDAISG